MNVELEDEDKPKKKDKQKEAKDDANKTLTPAQRRAQALEERRARDLQRKKQEEEEQKEIDRKFFEHVKTNIFMNGRLFRRSVQKAAKAEAERQEEEESRQLRKHVDDSLIVGRRSNDPAYLKDHERSTWWCQEEAQNYKISRWVRNQEFVDKIKELRNAGLLDDTVDTRNVEEAIEHFLDQVNRGVQFEEGSAEAEMQQDALNWIRKNLDPKLVPAINRQASPEDDELPELDDGQMAEYVDLLGRQYLGEYGIQGASENATEIEESIRQRRMSKRQRASLYGPESQEGQESPELSGSALESDDAIDQPDQVEAQDAAKEVQPTGAQTEGTASKGVAVDNRFSAETFKAPDDGAAHFAVAQEAEYAADPSQFEE